MKSKFNSIYKLIVAVGLSFCFVVAGQAAGVNAIVAPMFDKLEKRVSHNTAKFNMALSRRHIASPTRKETKPQIRGLGARMIVAPMFSPVATRVRMGK